MPPKIYSSLLLLLAPVLAIVLYSGGWSGGFFFDDYPNLGSLKLLDVIGFNVDGVLAYINAGFSGPTKRPVAMLSFILEYPYWPLSPAPFKFNNTLFHAINGLLVGWLAFLLSRRIYNDTGRAQWVAALTALIFLLHPLYVSTVLYVIQRMTLLAALFSLAAIIAYCKGREGIYRGRLLGVVSLCFFYPLLVLLSILSKENGALTVVFCALIEWLIYKHKQPLSGCRQRLIYLVVYGPAVVLLCYLFRNFGLNLINASAFEHRPFTAWERGLTQTRVLIDYIGKFFLPRIQTAGLYSDGIVVSKSFIHPITTLFSGLALLVCAVVAFVNRRRWPLLALAILVFFTGHIMESTFIPLELYFEHRNYLPMVLLVVFVADLLVRYIKFDRLKGAILAVLVLVLLASSLYQRANLWGASMLLASVWSEKNPSSVRAQLQVAGYWLNFEDYANTKKYIERAVEADQNNPRPHIYAEVLNCKADRRLINIDHRFLEGRLKKSAYHVSTSKYLVELIDYKIQYGCDTLSFGQAMRYLRAFESNARGNTDSRRAMIVHAMGNLMLAKGDIDASVGLYQRAMMMRRDLASGLVEVAMLASSGYFKAAIQHLDLAQEKVMSTESQSMIGDKSERAWLLSEMAIMRDKLNYEIHAQATQQ